MGQTHSDMADNCSFCNGQTGPMDDYCMIDSVGIYCGKCCRRMGLGPELIMPCGLCGFPVLGEIHIIQGHDNEYCSSCADMVARMGFE